MDIQASVAAILDDQTTVTKLFYEMFLERYPDVKKIFENVDLGRQAIKLSMALPIMQIHHENNFPTTRDYLELLGHKHHQRNVPEHLYPDFRDCLLDTLESFHGDDWTEELEKEWFDAIQKASDIMIRGYKSRRFD